ncbi:MAG: uncharacterized ferritin-like protein (DUF455 family) [Myxococcota bacterium]
MRNWAEQILTGTRLSDKLAPLTRLEDDRPGSAIALPQSPGRPAVLPLPDSRVRVPFPGDLSDPYSRGIVLHFFANHELLALELMALMLLRFPDAPRPFRRGLAATMLDEQRHLTMYLDRMAELSVSLGEIPVNDFFWRSLRGAKTPAAFSAGMSLTFEQANLDHARYYQAAFARAGDTKTAALMQAVYLDEINHVRQGVRWLRRWKPPEQDDWSAWTDLLTPPLTAARGKGRGFDREGRQQAGLTEAFINELEVFGHSRGRPPRVWWFNPGCEAEILNGQAPKIARTLAADLESLPMFLAVADDAVLLRRRPGTDHLRSLRAVGISIPELTLHDGDLTDHPLARRTLGPLSPWGVSPASATLLAPLGAKPWQPARAKWHRKSAALPVLSAVLDGSDWLAPTSTIGHRCTTTEETEATLDGPCVIKAELGAAGRGAMRVDGGLTEPQRRWLTRTLRSQGAVVVEPWLPRILDLSFHFTMTDDGARLEGTTRFFTDSRGQYLGHWLSRITDDLPGPLVRWLHGDGKDARRMQRVATAVGTHCATALPAYRGPLGVDALVYADGSSYRLKPVVELNPRWSMGRVALALQGRVANRTPAVFALLGPPALAALGLSSPGEVAGLAAAHPVCCDRGGQIQSGLLPLTEPAHAKAVVAVLAAGDAAHAIMDAMPSERSR